MAWQLNGMACHAMCESAFNLLSFCRQTSSRQFTQIRSFSHSSFGSLFSGFIFIWRAFYFDRGFIHDLMLFSFCLSQRTEE